MKAYRKSRSIALLILNLTIRWRWLVNFTHWQIYPQERTPLPTNLPPGKNTATHSRLPLGGSHSKSGGSVQQKNVLPLPGFELHIVQSIAESLNLLCYPTLLGMFLIASILGPVSRDSSHSCRTSILNHFHAVRRISGKLSLALLSSRFTFKTYCDTQWQNLHLQRHISEALNVSSTFSGLQKQTAGAFTITLTTGSSAVWFYKQWPFT